jgi:uncharacterized protein YukE
MNKLFIDCKTDEEKYNFFLSGQGYETGVIAASIQNDVAMAYKRCVSFQDELRRLNKLNAELAKPKQEWVGLTSEDWENLPDTGKQGCERDAEIFDWIESKLKELNT